MRVFPDTNVIVSAFATRGVCSDLLRVILAEHELLTAAVVIEETREVLRRKFGVPANTIREIESLLRNQFVVTSNFKTPDLRLRDHNDLLILGAALVAKAEYLITGDKDLLEIGEKPVALKIVSPREFAAILHRRRRPTPR